MAIITSSIQSFKPSSGNAAWQPCRPSTTKTLMFAGFKPSSGNAAWEPHDGGDEESRACLVSSPQAGTRPFSLSLHGASSARTGSFKPSSGNTAWEPLGTDTSIFHCFYVSSPLAGTWPGSPCHSRMAPIGFSRFKPSSGYAAWEPQNIINGQTTDTGKFQAL